MIFKSITSMQNYIQSACNIAVEKACERLLEELQKIIRTEYYDQYDPKEYVRTDSFFKSAVKEMLEENCGRIFMNENAMNYKAWTGELQLRYASLGYHGCTYIQTGGRFWDTFSEFFKKNVRQILKEELIKQGIPIIN